MFSVLDTDVVPAHALPMDIVGGGNVICGYATMACLFTSTIAAVGSPCPAVVSCQRRH